MQFLSFQKRSQVLSVRRRPMGIDCRLQTGGVEPTLGEGNFFQTGDLQPLPTLDDLDEIGSRSQVSVTARVQPSGSAPQYLDRKPTRFEVHSVQVGYLPFSTLGGFEFPRDRRCSFIIKIQTRNGIIGTRSCGFFLQGKSSSFTIEINHPVVGRVGHVISEDGGASAVRIGIRKDSFEIMTVKDVIPQNECSRSPSRKSSPIVKA